MDGFLWNQWNLKRIAAHGITPVAAEDVVRSARPPYPQLVGRGKWLVQGPTAAGQLAQVIYVLDPTRTGYVIHARPLTDREKQRYLRRKQR